MAEGGNIKENLFQRMTDMLEQGKITYEQYADFCDKMMLTPEMLEERNHHEMEMAKIEKGHEQRMKHLEDKSKCVEMVIDKQHEINKLAIEKRTEEITKYVDNIKTTGYKYEETEKNDPLIGKPKETKKISKGDEVIDREGNSKLLEKVSEAYKASAETIQRLNPEIKDFEQKQIECKPFIAFVC